jgi:hypothetical protein
VIAEARAAKPLSELQRAVVTSVAYSDVFDFPLTLEEVRRGLGIGCSTADCEAALAAAEELVSFRDPYYTLAGRESLTETRERRQAASAYLLRRADAYGRLIGRLPFVRMVAVTGSLAVENAEVRDDIDYLIVTAPGRLWLARSLAMAVVRLASLRGLTLCPNYLLAEDALALPERDVYTARELLQMRPLTGHAVYARMLDVNPWHRDLLPNWQPQAVPEDRGWSVLERLGERVLGGRLGDRLERWLLQRKVRELGSRPDANSETLFGESVCKGHFDAHRARLAAEWSRRLADMGMEP